MNILLLFATFVANNKNMAHKKVSVSFEESTIKKIKRSEKKHKRRSFSDAVEWMVLLGEEAIKSNK